MASLSTKPLYGLNTSKITSPFQKKMVDRDLQKIFFKDIHLLDFDILLIDFIDDRLNLILTDDGYGVTDSPEFKKSEINLNNLPHRILSCNHDLYKHHWQQGWKQFLHTLESIKKVKSLLINTVFYSNKDDRGEKLPHQNHINLSNSYLSWAYEQVSADLPKTQFLQYEDIEFISKSDHQWGKAPFHYTSSVEQACLAEIKNFYYLSAHH